MSNLLRFVPVLFVPLFIACADEPPPPPAYPPPPPPAPVAVEEDDPPAPPPPQQDIQIGVDGDAYSDTDPAALTDFKTSLDPHGSWTEDETYGTVWTPNPQEVGADFTPYVSSGHWAYGDDYVWASDYEWGWAPFHYGRWVWLGGRGWAWIPGRVYSGAWVDWRMGEGEWAYVGWAPRPPIWGWRGGVAIGIAVVPPGRYVYCAHGEIFEPRIGTRIVVGERVALINEHTRPYGVTAGVGGGHPFAQSPMHGPPPEKLGIESSRVVHVAATDRSVARAQQFSKPSAAQTMGARAATPHVVRPAPRPAAPSRAPARGRQPKRR